MALKMNEGARVTLAQIAAIDRIRRQHLDVRNRTHEHAGPTPNTFGHAFIALDVASKALGDVLRFYLQSGVRIDPKVSRRRGKKKGAA